MSGAPIVGIARHRMETDGAGVTTLVGFYGCPLDCRYCLNPFTREAGTPFRPYTAEALYREVKVDELYFLASGGGVTFGGGEPLLYAEFIAAFRRLCGEEWRLTAETSLAVPREKVEAVLGAVDAFIVDIKDTDPAVYRGYTGKDNALMLENLRWLAERCPERLTVRIPLIPDHNTEEHRRKSKALLASWGITNFDLFTYKTEDGGTPWTSKEE